MFPFFLLISLIKIFVGFIEPETLVFVCWGAPRKRTNRYHVPRVKSDSFHGQI